MNAAEQAKTVEAASKIAAVVNRFKTEFPDAKADLKPWTNDPETQELMDPDSIDVGFHFPGWSRRFQSRSMLLQLRFFDDPVTGDRRAIGAELAGFDFRGKSWRLSTIENWSFEGNCRPVPEIEDKLKSFLREALDLFNCSTSQPD